VSFCCPRGEANAIERGVEGQNPSHHMRAAPNSGSFFADPPNSLELGAGGGLVGLAVAKGCQVQTEQPMIITFVALPPCCWSEVLTKRIGTRTRCSI
jgi:lysine methyltransferase